MEQPTTPQSIEQPKGVEVSMQSTPRILLEVLVYGQESNKDAIKLFLDALQGQINRGAQGSRVRVFYYLDKGELTNEEKKQWLIANSSCKYYVFAHEGEDYTITNNFNSFVKDCTNAIKKLEASVETMKSLKITVKQQVK